MTTETAKLYENIKVTELEDSEVEIEGEIPISVIPPYRTKALKKIGENINIDGFRKGHIPEKILIEKVGEDVLLGEIAEMILADMYPNLMQEKNLNVIGAPKVTLTKLAPGNPIEFKIKSAILPEFNLPDYTEIAKDVMKEKDDLEVNNIDVEKVLTEVRRGKARFEKAQKQQEKRSENPDEVTSEGEPAKADNSSKSTSNVEEEVLPELDDAFIATLGDFKTVADFEVRVREDLGKERIQKAREKKRIMLSEKLIEKTDIKLPVILVQSELDKMLAQMKDDVARMNMKFEDYLMRTKKTEEDLRNEWKEQAKKRTLLQLLLNKIAQEEKIIAKEDAVRHEIEHILEHHKDANPDNVRIYVETQLTNEAVFKFLEEGNENKKNKQEK